MTTTNKCFACSTTIRSTKLEVVEVLVDRPGWKLSMMVNQAGKHAAITSTSPTPGGGTTELLFCLPCGSARVRQSPYRNSREWRALGFRPMFRSGMVYMADKTSTGLIYQRAVDQGRWMDHVDFSTWAKLDPSIPQAQKVYLDVVATLLACYCHSCPTGCDFCNGVRATPELERS